MSGCPFCASAQVEVKIKPGSDRWARCYVKCTTCGARGPVARSEALAASMWAGGVPRTSEVEMMREADHA